MKKRIRTDRLRSSILVSALITLVGFGTWISCSKDSGISSLEPGPRATKPAVTDFSDVDFHPQSGVNYDPFDGMTIAEREAAIGGAVVGEKYLEVMTYHLAHAMADDTARKILYENVPEPGEGTIHISELIMKYPYLLEVISGNFKRSVSDKAVVGGLSHVIQDTESDGKAILSASKALFDLEIRLVTPETGGWLPDEKIPVFYTPIDDEEATEIVGVNADLEVVKFPVPEDKQTPPYSLLIINFDEDVLVSEEPESGDASFTPHRHPHPPQSIEQESLWSWHNLFDAFSFTSPAYAHFPTHMWGEDDPHDPCYHDRIVQPLKHVYINTTSELLGDPPEIYVHFYWKDPTADSPFFFGKDLIHVDEVHEYYTMYAYLRTAHGTCGDRHFNTILLAEADLLSPDDTLGRWHDVKIPFGGFVPNQVDIGNYNGGLRMRRTSEDSF